jgi:hypothetical protein
MELTKKSAEVAQKLGIVFIILCIAALAFAIT